MKFFEEQIEKFARKANESQEFADPTFLRSDKLFYELQKEKLEAQIDAWRGAKPLVESESAPSRLLRSMGLENYAFPSIADYSTEYDKLKTIIERLGFPEKCCERVLKELALCEVGDLPKPHIMINTNQGCDPDRFTAWSVGRWFNIPVFFIDVGLNADDKPDLASLNYIADQLGEFIEWAEKKVPGVKYDEDKLIEIAEIDAIGEKYRREIYQLIKHIPCPISPLRGLRGRMFTIEPSRYPNMQKGIEFLRVCRDELGEQVASGKGPYPEERLRFLWAGQGHHLEALDPCKMLTERKVALPMHLTGHTVTLSGLKGSPYREMSEFGIKLSPLQEEARRLETSSWGGCGKRWVDYTLDTARDIGAHGIVHYLLLGCTPMRSMGSVVAERAEKELGIPVLNIEGRLLQDRDYISQEQFEELLPAFIDKCFDWAGKPRQ